MNGADSPLLDYARADAPPWQESPEWLAWVLNSTMDLTQFQARDVPELRDPRRKASSVQSLRIVELVAHKMFRTETGEQLAGRWNRWVGHTYINLLGVGRWMNAPAEVSGRRNRDGLLPIVVLPWGAHISPMLPAVLAAPGGTPRHGRVLRDELHRHADNHSAWVADGRPT